MSRIGALSWLLVFLVAAVATQPLFGLEKQLLYSFQDPDEFEIIAANKRAPLLNLVGSNVRFTEPFKNRILKKKIRSVQVDDKLLAPCPKEECPQLYH
ncbi:unnamed protein product [Caenorhabditis bovis]|uniref:Uncharacterized protein n=1 Tax=Caenorhabditis bovis TaxID=2654633 RepID=A0A8S1EZ36_9PELO|nr:unnamed protein product [Caenorhabditis bovis]